MAYKLAHILTIVSSLIFHLSIFRWIAAPVMKRISSTFGKLTQKKQVVITNSVMSLVHSVVVGGMGAYVFMYPGEVLPTKLWYDSPAVRYTGCIFLGYTVADLLVVPVLPYCSNLVFLQELSTPFVNLRIILYELGQKTSLLYKLNGVLMLVVFFSCRLATIPLWFQLSPLMETGELYTVGTALLITIFGCMPVVSVFNLYWFSKMCKGAYRILSRG
ncbi:TLC domain-containing protein 4-like isoform X4 [Branchiostoma floridae]|uniref:TLC domain-containing protein 4-like isoform X4 n=1 Tax=Branchiostoma floridae TaxID=7739 RepID=A0A9J7KFQ1_BRAFL|nr:TLC domain-containing protein 4-like isoform X4 [Branchiostoma floridae]